MSRNWDVEYDLRIERYEEKISTIADLLGISAGDFYSAHGIPPSHEDAKICDGMLELIGIYQSLGPECRKGLLDHARDIEKLEG